MNKIILLTIIFGSLILNILIFWISEKNNKLFFCEFGMMWLAYLHPIFEILKRLNGINILFLVASNKIILEALLKKLGYDRRILTTDRTGKGISTNGSPLFAR
jgi:hypothetical protein